MACSGEDDYTQEMCYGRQRRVLGVEGKEQNTYEIRCGGVNRADRKSKRNLKHNRNRRKMHRDSIQLSICEARLHCRVALDNWHAVYFTE